MTYNSNTVRHELERGSGGLLHNIMRAILHDNCDTIRDYRETQQHNPKFKTRRPYNNACTGTYYGMTLAFLRLKCPRSCGCFILPVHLCLCACYNTIVTNALLGLQRNILIARFESLMLCGGTVLITLTQNKATFRTMRTAKKIRVLTVFYIFVWKCLNTSSRLTTSIEQ